MATLPDDEKTLSLPLRPKSTSERNESPDSDGVQPLNGQDGTAPKTTLLSKQDDDDEIEAREAGPAQDDEEAAAEEPPFQIEAKKKKKKKSKSKMKRGENAPSGFEEYYVDPPMSVEEHAEERELYSPRKLFSERIQTAVHKYSSRRKFNPDRNQLWTAYLRYGGIDTSQKMFGGMEKRYDAADEDDGAGDIETLRAKNFVSEDVLNDQQLAEDEEVDAKYVVDFDGVAKSFFSMHLPLVMLLNSEEKVKLYTGVVRNWLNYLLHHEVCEEYKDQILAARKTCDAADKELWALAKMKLPDQFNEACRVIYTLPVSSTINEWAWDDPWPAPSEISLEEANRTFLTALAALADDELLDAYNERNESGGISITNSIETGIEITSIEPPTKPTIDLYHDPAAHGLIPVGKVKARTWYKDWETLPDLTEEEEAALPAKREAERRDYEFWIDEQAMSNIFVGLKMTVVIKQLNFGGSAGGDDDGGGGGGVFTFIHKVMRTFPSFVTWLPNDLMLGYREHEWIPPDREKMLRKLGLEADAAEDDGGE